MIMDAFHAADSELQISDAVLDAPSFLRLSDSMLYQIEHSRQSSLEEARGIVGRLRRRQLYRFVDETLLPKGSVRCFTEEEVVSFQNSGSSGIELRPEDIVLFVVKLNFGRGDQNPIDSIYFFKDWGDTAPIHIRAGQFSYVLPTVFQERIVRVYLKKHFSNKADEQRAKAAVKEAFRRCMRAAGINGSMPSPVPKPPGAPDVVHEGLVQDENTEGSHDSDILASVGAPSPSRPATKRSKLS